MNFDIAWLSSQLTKRKLWDSRTEASDETSEKPSPPKDVDKESTGSDSPTAAEHDP